MPVKWVAADWARDCGQPEARAHLYEVAYFAGRIIGYVVQFQEGFACYGCVNGQRLGAIESVEAAKGLVENTARERLN